MLVKLKSKKCNKEFFIIKFIQNYAWVESVEQRNLIEMVGKAKIFKCNKKGHNLECSHFSCGSLKR